MATEGATFHLLDLAVEVHVPLPGVLVSLTSLWRGALAPMEPPSRTQRLEVRPGAGWDLWSGGDRVAHTDVEADVLPLLEEELVQLVHLRAREAGRALLHAAGFVLGGQAFVAVGDSGAGKSTLTLAAVRRGASLLSDEWVVTDGERLWGVPRAIQFDPIPAGDALPPWLEGLPVPPLSFPGRDGRHLAVPHLPVDAAPGPVPARGVRLVVLARGASTAAQPLDAVQALAALLEAQRVPQPLDWAPWTRGAVRLTWEDGPSGLDALLRA